LLVVLMFFLPNVVISIYGKFSFTLNGLLSYAAFV
jgi:hypothetical protein